MIQVLAFHKISYVEWIEDFYRAFWIAVQQPNDIYHDSFYFINLRIDQADHWTVVIKQLQVALQNRN